MQLLIVRHAIAEEREEFAKTGRDDSERPLTKDGRRKMKRNARALRTLVPRVDVLATSPFARAAATADIVAAAYDDISVDTVPALTPHARYKDLLAWLRGQAERRVVAVVGHEPHLTGLVGLLLTGRDEHPLVLRKGGACLLEFGDEAGDDAGDGDDSDSESNAAADDADDRKDAASQIGPRRAKLLWSLTPGQLRLVRS